MPSEDPATSPATAANPPPDHRLPAEGGPGHAEVVELEPRHTLEEPTPQLPAQPRAGILGLIIVALGFVILGVLPGGPQHALETVGPIATFALPVLGVSALWWEGWPAQKLHQPLAGLANLALIIIGGIVLTVIAQAVIGEVDLNGVFAVPAKASTTFPDLALVDAARRARVRGLPADHVRQRALAVRSPRRPACRRGRAARRMGDRARRLRTDRQLGHRSGRCPARHRPAQPRWPRRRSHPAGLAGLRHRLPGPFYIGLGGWPTIHLQNPVARLTAANALTIGGGWLTWLLLFHGFGWATPTIAALAAAVAAAAVISAILFDNWPAASLRSAGTQIPLLLAQTALITAALYFGLRALGDAIQTWNRDPVDLWVTVSCLNFIAATAILHVAVFHRWPVITSRST